MANVKNWYLTVLVLSYVSAGVLGVLYVLGIKPDFLKLVVGFGFIMSGFLSMRCFGAQEALKGFLKTIMTVKPGVSSIFLGGVFVFWFFNWEPGMWGSAIGFILCQVVVAFLFGRHKTEITGLGK